VSVAVLSLGAAVLFNALAVRDSARQSVLSRQSSELATLFQVEQAAKESLRILYNPEFLEANPRDFELSERRADLQLERQFREAISDLDYTAFLLNNDYLTITGVRERWQNNLNCIWILAVTNLPRSAPELWTDLKAIARHGVCTGPGGNHSVAKAEAEAEAAREELNALDGSQ
jgi:hypothetical protein